jgi:hypothetical protein
MALQRRLTKEQYSKLSDALKFEYVEDGDGWRLDVSGEEDTGSLKRAKDREVQLRREAEEKLKEAETRLSEIEGDDARKTGDVKTLEKSWQKKRDDDNAAWQKKYDADLKAANDKLSKLSDYTKKQLIDAQASALSTELVKAGINPKILVPHIKSRLSVDFEGDEPKSLILDATGKPSKATYDELKAEFVANKDFSDIIAGTKATGGGANRVKTETTNHQGSADKPIDLSRLNPADMVAHLDSKST